MQKREPRQLNVQQQNARLEDGLRSEARYWRANGVPPALQEIGSAQGVDWSKSIILRLDVDYPGLSGITGILLTQTQQFIAFSIDTDNAQMPVLEEWADITHQQNCKQHNRGIGAGYGAIAIKVQRELNIAGTVLKNT